MMALLKKSLAGLGELWSVTRFEGVELSEYAESLMFSDARKGIMALGLVSLSLLVSSAFVYALLEYDTLYVYSCAVLAVLSFHVMVSARTVKETQTLYLLGITLLVVNGVAFVLLAHHSGSFNSALFASVILLFMVMPLVPWGLREAVLIVVLVYLIFTLSTLSVEGKFDADTLLMLQFAMLGAGLSTLTVIARAILVRRDDIKSRYELEKAHDHMALLSLKDPLTGAWNRRFLEQKFSHIMSGFHAHGDAAHFVLIDVDNFKQLNDSHGHDFGDLVLRRLVASFLAQFSDHEHLVRMGGDEFAILLSGNDPESVIRRGATALQTDTELFAGSADRQVFLSVGLMTVEPGKDASLDTVYRLTDKALYKAKKSKTDQQPGFSMEAVEYGV